MKNPIKKVAAINDLSGIGRAALASIIPIMSTMGIQVCSFPTAVLSTHTGGFKKPLIVDLTNTMRNYMNHWISENIEFDSIYSGYLGSDEQVDIIMEFIRNFKTESNIVVIDPVMADEGKLYSSMNEKMVTKMRELIGMGDIITPNLTEALYLLDKEQSHPINEESIKTILLELADYGPNIVIITSVPDEFLRANINVNAYDKINNKFFKISTERLPINFPGTGDAFTSVLLASILQGLDLYTALHKSVDFISFAINESIKYSYPKREGILLEKVLYKLNL